MQKFSKDAKRIGLSGASGSGKSTRAKHMLEGKGRQIVFDPMDEYKDYGYKPFYSIPDLGKWLKANWHTNFMVCYKPPMGGEEEALHKVSLMLMEFQKPYCNWGHEVKINFIVEELNKSFGVNSLPKKHYGFGEICSRGRHFGIELYGITQRWAEVNTRFRGNLEETYIFRPSAYVDIQAITQMIGPEYRDKIRGLQTHEYLKIVAGDVTDGKNILK